MPTNEIYDVVVIGAGITGALAARKLAEASLNVAVLEAGDLLGGTSARCAGLALLGTPQPFAVLQERLGEGMARRIWHLTQENLAMLQETLAKYNLSGTQIGSLRLTAHSRDAEIWQQSVAQLQSLGYTVSLEDGTDWGYLLGIQTQEDVLFEVSALVEALLSHPRITVETQAEVLEIRSHSSGHKAPLTLWTRQGTVWARGAVLSAGAYAVHLSRVLGTVVHPMVMQTVTLHNPESLPEPLVLDDGQVTVLSVGDIWQMCGWSTDEVPPLERLDEVAKSLCPQARVISRRVGWAALSEDNLPLVGELPELPGVYTIGGLGPWGLSWAFVAVERLFGLMINDADPGLISLQRTR